MLIFPLVLLKEVIDNASSVSMTTSLSHGQCLLWTLSLLHTGRGKTATRQREWPIIVACRVLPRDKSWIVFNF